MTKFTHCTVSGCTGKHRAKGLCYGHYSRHYKTGTIGTKPVTPMFRSEDFADGTRTCNRCSLRLPLTQYYRSKTCALGRRSTCIACTRKTDRARRAVAPDVYAALDRLSNIRRRTRLANLEFDPLVTHDALRERDGDGCHYCDRPMSFERMKRGEARRDRASIDHVVPISRGGSHTFENTVLACLDCNFRKNARTADEWSVVA